jgi:hypothetical protein
VFRLVKRTFSVFSNRVYYIYLRGSYYCDNTHRKGDYFQKLSKMTQKELAELTDQELLQEAKKIKSTKLSDILIIGVLIGIAIYSTVKNGFGLLSFLPLVYAPIAVNNQKKNKELEDLLKAKNLK